MKTSTPLVFGPVPSRRLGRSLGINNVPPKSCTYSCIYCQVGPTEERETEPRPFLPAEELVAAVTRRVRRLRKRGERIDYLTFVPDGEPTIDEGLAAEIEGLRPLGLPIAVISNASQVWREEVRSALGLADWVSLKVDSVEEATWRRMNRPHPTLRLEAVLDGIDRFAREARCELVTETMLVAGVNDTDQEADATSAFLECIRPRAAYLAVPTRPPAEPGVRPPDETVVTRVFQRFAERLPRVELLTGYEGDAFGATGDAAEDLLAVTAVHPMREEAALALLARNGADRTVLDRLVSDGSMCATEYMGHTFYIRRFPRQEETVGA
jgi:wyosine [tRNA(Phe)-imidazoG37] synthetase (radical SAM superfamily)